MSKQTYTNPIMVDCADPGVFAVNGSYYLSCTDKGRRMFKSSDLVHWQDVGPAFTYDIGAPYYWSPDFVQKGNDFYVVYTRAWGITSSRRDLMIARASKPEGPYSLHAGPLFGGRAEVDGANFFKDTDGTIYLFYNLGQGQNYGSTMTTDMKNAVGEFPVLDFSSKEPWQVSPVQEGPVVFRRGNRLYVLISGHHTMIVGGYAVFCASAPTPRGPWKRQPNNPVLCGICKNKGIIETGSGSVIERNGKFYYMYHGTTGGSGTRDLCIDEIVFDGDLLTIPGGAIREPRPYPG